MRPIPARALPSGKNCPRTASTGSAKRYCTMWSTSSNGATDAARAARQAGVETQR